MGAKKLKADYLAIAKTSGLRWLGPEVDSVFANTSWRCQKRHVWNAPYARISRGVGCPYCAGNARKQPDDYHSLARNRQFNWLGPSVRRNSDKTSWECPEGHTWTNTYANIKRGAGCPKCTRIALSKLLTKHPSDYHQIAWQKGMVWLGPEVSGASKKTWWQCTKGHRIRTTYSSISSGKRCKKCVSCGQRRQPSDYRALAKARNIRWLGKEVQGNKVLTPWKCETCNHTWKASFTSIKGAKGCPVCVTLLLADKRRRKPDYYRAIAQQQGLEWLGKEVKTVGTKTPWRCNTCGHQWESTLGNIKQGFLCPVCGRIRSGENRRRTPADYLKAGEILGLRWLGKEALGTHLKTPWQCLSCGHTWEAEYAQIQQGSGCARCARRRMSEKFRLETSAYKRLAKSKNLNWTGPPVNNNRVKTSWLCLGCDKAWMASYENVYSSTHGCPDCAIKKRADKKRLSVAAYQRAAKKRSATWIGDRVTTANTRTKWKCSTHGHVWWATYNNVNFSTGCPRCVDYVNGNAVSKPQRLVSKMLSKWGKRRLNYKLKPRDRKPKSGGWSVDIVMHLDRIKIAIEYDSYHWHVGRFDKSSQDKAKTAYLRRLDYRVLRIKADFMLPTQKCLDNAVRQLLNGTKQKTIYLTDWHTARDRRHKKLSKVSV